ncbi:hypothetical protein OH76DRAFT_723779 [Lentinus brumalis]|uniref:F-box domain-containing protein n=1 Tax=Lentinus brumalis TaxID=2498619 RepID=A0A371D511_9APHY|nr:hypothetical protein OH76DRAFT_723779 [Polyporus brumalis]
MASVFPIEIYEHIMELAVENRAPSFTKVYMLSWSLVCRAWRRQCRPYLFQFMRYRYTDLPALYTIRQRIVERPDLASLVEVIEVEHTRKPYGSEIEMFPIVIYKHFPRLRRINIFLEGAMTWRTYPHRYFRVSHLRFESVTELLLRGLVLRHTSELDIHLSMFPRLRTLCLTNIYWFPEAEKGWPSSPRFMPPITDLQLGEVKV